MAADAGGIRAGRAFVEIGANLKNLTAGLNRGAAMLKGWGKSVTDLGNKVAAVGAKGAKVAAGVIAGTVYAVNAALRDIAKLDPNDLGIARDFIVAFEVLKANLQELGRELAVAVAPAVSAAMKALIPFVQAIIRLVENNPKLVQFAFMAIAAFGAVSAAVLVLGKVLVVLGAAFSAVGTVIGLVSTAIGAIFSPIGLTVIAVVALTAAFLKYTETGRQAVQFLTEVFSAFLGDLQTIFGGVADALAAGDLQLAAEVLWAGWEVVWQRGVNILMGIWETFKAETAKVFSDIWIGVQLIWNDGISSLQTLWVESVAFFQSAWVSFTDGVVGAWQAAVNLVAKAMLRLRAVFDSSVDVEGAIAELNAEAERRREGRSKSGADRKAQIEAARKARRAAIEKGRSKEEERLGQQSLDIGKEIDADKNRRLAPGAQKLADLMKALTTSRGKAATAKQNTKPLNIPFGPTDASAMGTFSARAAGALGGPRKVETQLDKIIQATQATANNTKNGATVTVRP